MKQRKLFSVTLSRAWKTGVRKLARENRCEYGVMFSTSGKACLERINPNAQYNYVWRSGKLPKYRT